MKRKRGKTGFQALTVATLKRQDLAALLIHFEQLHRDVEELGRQVAELRALGELLRLSPRPSRRKTPPAAGDDLGAEERRESP